MLDELFKAVLERLLSKVTGDYERFLDDRSQEWTNKLRRRMRKKPVQATAPKADERLMLLLAIIAETERNCRRDIDPPGIVLTEQQERLERYTLLREEVGKGPHPTALSHQAYLHMLRHEYAAAEPKLWEAIKLNDASPPDYIQERCDSVGYLVDLSRCSYLREEFDQAIRLADEALERANALNEDAEKEDFIRVGAAPDTEIFQPCLITAYMGGCDARVQHGNWGEDESLARQFRGLWDVMHAEYNVPNSLLPPDRIALLSDKRWVIRAEPYVEEIARSLYVDLAPTVMHRSYRAARVWCGFQLDSSRIVSVAACVGPIIVCLALLAPEGPAVTKDTTIKAFLQNKTVIELTLDEGLGDSGNPQELQYDDLVGAANAHLDVDGTLGDLANNIAEIYYSNISMSAGRTGQSVRDA